MLPHFHNPTQRRHFHGDTDSAIWLNDVTCWTQWVMSYRWLSVLRISAECRCRAWSSCWFFRCPTISLARSRLHFVQASAYLFWIWRVAGNHNFLGEISGFVSRVKISVLANSCFDLEFLRYSKVKILIYTRINLGFFLKKQNRSQKQK